ELPVPSPLARLIADETSISYVIRADNNETAVRLKFGPREISALLEQSLGSLGTGGEMFLRDASGAFLTPPRFGGASVPVASAEGRYECTRGPDEWEDIDYRGVQTFHGVHAVAVFPQSICVDAHLPYDEALAPAAALLSDLIIRAAQFAGVGIV